MNLEDERKALCALPCKCVTCPDCHGFGHDDDDDVTECYYCHGSGFSEQCSRCEQLDELDDALDELAREG